MYWDVEAKLVYLPFTHLLIKNVNCDYFFAITYEKDANVKRIYAIKFLQCSFDGFPRAEPLRKVTENLTYLSIIDCKLTEVKHENFKGLESLEDLYLDFNVIEKLPKKLFIHTPKLRNVSFKGNKIKVIDADILDPLVALELFDLRNNVSINAIFERDMTFRTLTNFKREIKKCDPTQRFIARLQQKIDDDKKEILKLNQENAAVKMENVAIKMENDKLHLKVDELETEFKKLKEMKEKKIICDFTVSVNGRAFQTNKETLAVNSPVLKRLIDENQGADHLELKDVSEATFEEILNFMHTKNPPNNAVNLVELYAASARLKMKELMDLTAEILMDKVTPYNAPDILYLCKKYGHEELRLKAFEELKKTFPDKL